MDRRMDVSPIAITCVSLLTHVKKSKEAAFRSTTPVLSIRITAVEVVAD